MAYTNSSLVSYTCYSPNHSGTRTHSIDRITPHCVVGQCTVQALGQVFLPSSRQASSNYGVGYDGKVGLYVDQKNRSWCSSSGANDQRAITIEIASDTTSPYAIKDAAYNTTIKLMADICKRNGKTKLVYIANKTQALAYSDNGQKSNEMLITLHQWFASTICPGQYIINHLPDMVNKVNAILSGGSSKTTRTLFEQAQYMITNNINGQARKNQAVADGFTAEQVQKQIDLILGKDTSLAIKDLAAIMPDIKEGSSGGSTSYLQKELKRMGYYTGEIDGEAGTLTVTAIKKIQTNWNKVYGGITVDGVFGTSCWNRLLLGS